MGRVLASRVSGYHLDSLVHEKISDFRSKDILNFGMCFFMNTNSNLNF